MIQQFKNLSIRIKIFSIFVLILLLVSFFNFIYFPWKQKQQVTQALQARAETSAQMVAAGVSLALESGDFEFIDQLLTLAKRDEHILYIAICDDDGKPTISFNPNEMLIPSLESFGNLRTIEKEDALHTTSVMEIADIDRTLIIGFSLVERNRAIDEIRVTGFLVSAATLMFGLLLSVYLSRLMIKPLSQLVASIDHISEAEDYESTIEKSSLDEVGKLIDAFNGMTTALQARTVERKQALETLQESEDRFRSLVQTAGTVIMLLAPDHRILEWNREAERIYGWRREEVLGKDYLSMFLSEDVRQIMAANIKKVLAGQPTVGLVNPVITRNGTQRQLQWNATRILDAVGEPIGVIASGQDITDHQLLENQLRQLQKMEAVGQLTAGVAHNFNNMLAGIMGNLELARAKAPADLDEILKDAEHASDRAAAIVKQLMLFTRSGDSVEARPIKIQDVLNQTVDMCRVTFDRRIEIVVSVSESPVMMGDADQLQQVFLNLLLNARDALAEAGASDPRIDIAMDVVVSREYQIVPMEAAPGDYARIRITDNGVGMNEATVDRVFEPFFTTKEVGKGTGLGLSTAYAIVRKHQGWIEHESQLGVGTAFSVHLPALAQQGIAEKLESDTTVARGTETLLIIDDEPVIRKMLASQLSMFGYTVLLGVDGEDGLGVYQRRQGEISLVLLDLSMPNMSGREVFPLLRQLNPEVKVVIFTGYAANPTEFPQAQAVIQKPFKTVGLAGKVREVLDA